MLEQRRLWEILRYDPQTGVFIWLNPSPYHAEKAGSEAGGPTPNCRGKIYHTICIDGRKYKRSRLAWLYMTGSWPTNQVDHINGNSTDDRWANLRESTATQNAWNHKKRAKRSVLPMGVRSNPSGTFAARLAVNKKMIHLGSFATPEEAASAYRNAREKHYGEFA
jgi:hypothetical protein